MAQSQLQIPMQFDFSKPEDWERWIRRFERFRQASGLAEKTDETQVSTLIYSMGDKAEDVLQTLGLNEEQKKDYKTVKETMTSFFEEKRNIIYERAKFNQRVQFEGEPVDEFITSLYSLVEHCSYGELTNEMIRDRLVVGPRDAKLSEQLQLDAELTLEKAVIKVRQSESVKKQQDVIRASAETTQVARVKSNQVWKDHKKLGSYTTARKFFPAEGRKRCHRCGKVPEHSKSQCPAKDCRCKKCGRMVILLKCAKRKRFRKYTYQRSSILIALLRKFRQQQIVVVNMSLGR